MKHLLYILISAFLLVGCKSPEARMPETVQSGSFLKESAKRNKKLNEKEQEIIKTIIKNNPEKFSKASYNTPIYKHYDVKYRDKLDQELNHQY